MHWLSDEHFGSIAYNIGINRKMDNGEKMKTIVVKNQQELNKVLDSGQKEIERILQKSHSNRIKIDPRNDKMLRPEDISWILDQVQKARKNE